MVRGKNYELNETVSALNFVFSVTWCIYYETERS